MWSPVTSLGYSPSCSPSDCHLSDRAMMVSTEGRCGVGGVGGEGAQGGNPELPLWQEMVS